MDEFEDLLRRYRPSGPPPELRDRILDGTRRRWSVLEWLPAVAALILAVVFSWLASNERRIVESHFTPVPPIEQSLFAEQPIREQPLLLELEDLQR